MSARALATIGVGAGNVPVYIERSADVPFAVDGYLDIPVIVDEAVLPAKGDGLGTRDIAAEPGLDVRSAGAERQKRKHEPPHRAIVPGGSGGR